MNEKIWSEFGSATKVRSVVFVYKNTKCKKKKTKQNKNGHKWINQTKKVYNNKKKLIVSSFLNICHKTLLFTEQYTCEKHMLTISLLKYYGLPSKGLYMCMKTYKNMLLVQSRYHIFGYFLLKINKTRTMSGVFISYAKHSRHSIIKDAENVSPCIFWGFCGLYSAAIVQWRGKNFTNPVALLELQVVHPQVCE